MDIISLRTPKYGKLEKQKKNKFLKYKKRFKDQKTHHRSYISTESRFTLQYDHC